MERSLPLLVLASASPRRLDLLNQAMIVPDKVDPANIDETPDKKELPRVYVERMARQKAHCVRQRHDQGLVLAADTVVALGRRVLPKAEDEAQVEACLRKLSGRAHTVMTAVCLIACDGKVSERVCITRVVFKHLSDEEIRYYLKSCEGIGKAGGYAIQGLAATYVKQINGSYSNVVGLPLYETANMLKGNGYV